VKFSPELRRQGVTGFRVRLLVGMMFIVSCITAVVLYVVERKVSADAEQASRMAYENELAAMHRLQELRHTALVERCKTLVHRPRIHAALEDNALDLLYPSARDELRDVMDAEDEVGILHATFYRFLDASGRVIKPPKDADVGELSAEEEAHLALKQAPATQQTGYLLRKAPDGGETVDAVIAAPVISTETHEVIAALVLGFKPFADKPQDAGIQRAIWVDGRMSPTLVEGKGMSALALQMSHALALPDSSISSLQLDVRGVPHRAFFMRLNPESMFSPAFEMSLHSLEPSMLRLQQLRWQIVSAGAVLLLVGLAASHLISARLSVPVEKLAHDSAVNFAGREQAEAALVMTHVELQRSVRFSADASHQLKTPVTVLRAGLEELLQQPGLSERSREEVEALIRQTARLTSMIHDLLLLSRMDAGRLRLDMVSVNLSQLVASLADDLSVLPDAADVTVEIAVPDGLHILGEKRYTAIILQNLLENAWKYNERGGRVRIVATVDQARVCLSVGNSGVGIPGEAQPHVFERFHRAAANEGTPGHGLGLDLARELARLHGGELRLVRSIPGWTEFEAIFLQATVADTE
jgi:signal transduction histidine kinase